MVLQRDFQFSADDIIEFLTFVVGKLNFLVLFFFAVGRGDEERLGDLVFKAGAEMLVRKPFRRLMGGLRLFLQWNKSGAWVPRR